MNKNISHKIGLKIGPIKLILNSESESHQATPSYRYYIMLCIISGKAGEQSQERDIKGRTYGMNILWAEVFFLSSLVISLDFELFWGVTDSRTIDNYGTNIEGVWHAVPGLLKLFKKYDIHATWATVGMLLCKDFNQWAGLCPAILPTYKRNSCSTYSVAILARNFPKLFFAPVLVEQILTTDSQELASHTYSHFYCGEENTTVEQFAADLDCSKRIFDEYRVKPTSIVFPRNQVRDEYLKVLVNAGFTAYRGNQDHWMYRDGHLGSVSYFTARRLIRAVDAVIPLIGNHTFLLPSGIPTGQLINIPASRFLRPVSGHSCIDKLHLNRIKRGMLEAARTNRAFHLWWHPHNFGLSPEANLVNLEKLLKYYCKLNHEYGMQSFSMRELEASCRIN
ncbi:polysaccharide deacetylase family protein [Candidatus Methylobacter favarea]|nr:polysaccharide deacetylase family protein [Candidatus Methylobacter favarea]